MKTGALRNYPDNRRITYDRKPSSTIVIPDKKIIDISHIPVLNQGSLPTCVAHAGATVKMFQEHKETGKILPFSRRFLYALARTMSNYEGIPEGLFPADLAKVMNKIGALATDSIDAFISLMEYQGYKPTENEVKAAKKFKTNYATGSFSDVDKALVNNELACIALDVDPSAWLTSGEVLKPEDVESSHYVVIYGREKIGNRIKYYFRNSWGDRWGNKGNGFFYLDDYRYSARDVLIFTDLPNDLVEEAQNTRFKFTLTIKKGSKGNEVKELQKYLGITADGIFGNQTDIMVKKFQKDNGLYSDGIVGAKTRAVLNKIYPTRSVVIKRTTFTTHQTLGRVDAKNGDKKLSCYSIELPWLNNQKNISCIPTGTYKVKMSMWASRGKPYYEVQKVAGRTGIFLHEGNFYFNYLGCIGLGDGFADMNKDGIVDITNTLATLDKLVTLMGGEDFDLTIINE